MAAIILIIYYYILTTTLLLLMFFYIILYFIGITHEPTTSWNSYQHSSVVCSKIIINLSNNYILWYFFQNCIQRYFPGITHNISWYYMNWKLLNFTGIASREKLYFQKYTYFNKSRLGIDSKGQKDNGNDSFDYFGTSILALTVFWVISLSVLRIFK